MYCKKGKNVIVKFYRGARWTHRCLQRHPLVLKSRSQFLAKTYGDFKSRPKFAKDVFKINLFANLQPS